jgi:CRP/FNR family transcriptional regulator
MLSTMEKILFLKRAPTFESMSSEQLRIISDISIEENFEKGEIIFKQGDLGDKMYVIVEGNIAIVQEGEKEKKRTVLVTLGEKNVVGEMSILDDETRSATGEAVSDCKLLAIGKEELKEMIREYPELAFEIFKVLSRRIRESNKQIRNLQQKVDSFTLLK